jgi:hypothetical protein
MTPAASALCFRNERRFSLVFMLITASSTNCPLKGLRDATSVHNRKIDVGDGENFNGARVQNSNVKSQSHNPKAKSAEVLRFALWFCALTFAF